MSSTGCATGNDYDGRIGLRISSIFVILVGSGLGALVPVYAARHRTVGGFSKWAFFVGKYFGSGVILATAFIHLLAPAEEALKNECLTGPITEYTWVEGICLMTVFSLFFVELMTMRFAKFGHSHDHEEEPSVEKPVLKEFKDDPNSESSEELPTDLMIRDTECPTSPHVPGDDHLSHSRQHDPTDIPSEAPVAKGFDPESYAAQMTALAILEFGVIFHSIFIGLTLAVSGAEFITLYVVLTFHQTFEGLALGSRLGSIEWPESKKWTPYFLGLGYALATPIAIAIGLGVRTSLDPNSQSFLIINGVFDSISAGILIYTGLVELMAHEFMFSAYMQKAPIGHVMGALGCMVLGSLCMAVLGKWA